MEQLLKDIFTDIFKLLYPSYSQYMHEQIEIIVPILVAILTGGFLMLFIENQHVTSSVNEKFDFIMKPFYHKLSNYFLFISSFRTYLRKKDDKSKNANDLYALVDKLGHMAFPCVMDGRDYPVTFFTARKLKNLCLEINKIWRLWSEKQYYLKDHLYYETVKADQFSEEGKKCLHEVSGKYDGKSWTMTLLMNVSSDFFNDIWKPISHVPSYFEYWNKQTKEFSILTIASISVAIITLLLILLLRYIIPIWMITLFSVASIVLLTVAIYKMVKLNKLSSKLFR